MPATPIGPNQHIRPYYDVPAGSLIRFRVQSDRSVETYIMDGFNLGLFQRGDRGFRYFGGFPTQQTYHTQELRIPTSGGFYLVIVNRDPQAAAFVQYDVTYV